MTIATFIVKNALRNKRRAALTILSVAVSCALLVTLLTLQRELTIPPESEAASLRVIVRNKVSLAQPLPAKQLATLDKIPGERKSDDGQPAIARLALLAGGAAGAALAVVPPRTASQTSVCF